VSSWKNEKEERPVAELAEDWMDWSELGLKLEEVLDLDIDIDEWNALGGDPGPDTEIDINATIDQVIEFMEQQPEMTPERLARLTLCEFRDFSDPDLVPAEFMIECTPARWMQLLEQLQMRFRSRGVEFDHSAWKDLGRGTPATAQQVIEFAQRACRPAAA